MPYRPPVANPDEILAGDAVIRVSKGIFSQVRVVTSQRGRFDLGEIAIRRNPNAFAEHRASLTNGAYVTSLEQAASLLGVYSAVMKDTCAPILGGDLSL